MVLKMSVENVDNSLSFFCKGTNFGGDNQIKTGYSEKIVIRRILSL